MHYLTTGFVCLTGDVARSATVFFDSYFIGDVARVIV
jgi:hypothetical protein